MTWLLRYFDCACKRCLDPTELGTHLNTLLCQKCRLEEKNSFLLPENVRNQNGDWRCDGCENIVRNEEAKKLVEKFNAEILQLSTTDRWMILMLTHLSICIVSMILVNCDAVVRSNMIPEDLLILRHTKYQEFRI